MGLFMYMYLTKQDVTCFYCLNSLLWPQMTSHYSYLIRMTGALGHTIYWDPKEASIQLFSSEIIMNRGGCL